jgi:MFS family permease
MEFTPGLRKRLRPLYVAAFFQGLVFWYPVEKLFMRSIGFSDALIGLFIAIYSVVMILTEIPAGVLADRWSRKGVLMISSVMLSLSALAGGMSHGLGLFLVSACLWGVFFAMYSGANDAIVYDLLAEDGHDSNLFEKAFGRVRTIDSLALVIGSLGGGTVAAVMGTRMTFFLTIPGALASIAALAVFREPRIHKAKEAGALTEHIRMTLRAVFAHRRLLPVLVMLVLTAALEYLLFEFAQVWLLALHTPTVWYGPANAIILAALGVGGFIAGHIRARQQLLIPLVAAMLVGSVGLTVIHNIAAVVACQFVVIMGAIVLGIFFLRDLHDNLSAHIRTGASSAVSTMGRLLIIPLAILLGVASSAVSIFVAGWLIVMLVISIAGIVVYLRLRGGR